MRIITISLTLLLLSACGAQPSIEKQASGFLPQDLYQQMRTLNDSNGQQGKRWIAPDFDRTLYDSVYIEPMHLYSSAKPSEHISLATLQDIERLGTEKLRQSLGAKVPLASAPGPGVLVIDSAITGVIIGEEALKFYQYIPFSLAIQGIKSAAGLRGQEVYIVLEAKLSDGANQKAVAAMLRAVKGKHLKNNYEALSPAHIEGELGNVLEQVSQRLADVILAANKTNH